MIGIRSIGKKMLSAIMAERVRQEELWGEQNHPDFNPGIEGWIDGAESVSLIEGRADYYNVPTPHEAKHALELDSEEGNCSWFGILLEEVCETLEAKDPQELKAELIQVIAVCTKWIECIDRRGG